METHRIVEMIFNAVQIHNESAEPENRLDPSEDTVLFGIEGRLDSLQLVSLIVAIEEAVQDEFEVPVSIADERALTRTPSPFRTLGSLAEYVSDLLREEGVV